MLLTNVYFTIATDIEVANNNTNTREVADQTDFQSTLNSD